ncbi:MAG: hypothetical protein BWX55_01076 [Deltaproteobacteria bacterium ADurb.Bin022]|nr:MAG: hypothetical protein BWX55_01076 [Deltaproteobacteria bacterium ADurb.Bin022]
MISAWASAKKTRMIIINSLISVIPVMLMPVSFLKRTFAAVRIIRIKMIPAATPFKPVAVLCMQEKTLFTTARALFYFSRSAVYGIHHLTCRNSLLAVLPDPVAFHACQLVPDFLSFVRGHVVNFHVA